jgi:hypothetical protein
MDQSQQLLSFAAAFGSFGEEGIAIRADAGLAMSAKPSHLIVTVHGIRTYGHWQERLEQLVTAAAGDHDVEFVRPAWLELLGEGVTAQTLIDDGTFSRLNATTADAARKKFLDELQAEPATSAVSLLLSYFGSTRR